MIRKLFLILFCFGAVFLGAQNPELPQTPETTKIDQVSDADKASQDILPQRSESSELAVAQDSELNIEDGPAIFLSMWDLKKLWTMSQAQELLAKIYNLEDKVLAEEYLRDIRSKILYQNKDLRERYYNNRLVDIFEKFEIEAFTFKDFDGWLLLSPTSVAPEDLDVEKWIKEFSDLVVCSGGEVLRNESLDSKEFSRIRKRRLDFSRTKISSPELFCPFLIKTPSAAVAYPSLERDIFLMKAGIGVILVSLAALAYTSA